MKVQITDFNHAAELIASDYAHEWDQVDQALRRMPLHLKASDQQGLQGNPIFDAVGTNHAIKGLLVPAGWASGVPLPPAFRFLGTGVDFGNNGAILEVQFSNYPFLLNNLMRSELLFKSRTAMAGSSTSLLIVVTKARMFPASQSTLYYEQAKSQVNALATNNVFEIPIRLVGLFEDIPSQVPATWTSYHAARYSRTVVSQQAGQCRITAGRTARSRAILSLT